MIALIDSDIVAFRCAASAEQDPKDVALFRIDKLMADILQVTGAETYQAYLSGSDNYRKEVDPLYKANRKDKPPPQYLEDCREHLVTKWKANVVERMEADDMLAIQQTKQDDSIICSIDKDLLMVEGKHYNFVKEEFYSTDSDYSWRHFYTQLLAGDSSDNIFGFDGKARGSKIPQFIQRMVESLGTEDEAFEYIREQYNDDNRLLSNGVLLWMQRDFGDLWTTGLQRLQNHVEQELVEKITKLAQELKREYS